jgi:hypothetical protein
MVPSYDRETGASKELMKCVGSMRWLLVEVLGRGVVEYSRSAVNNYGRDWIRRRLDGVWQRQMVESRCGGRG